MYSLFLRLWAHITPRRRLHLFLLLALISLSSLVETVSIGAIVPFLAVLVSPEMVFSRAELQPLISWMGIRSAEELILPMTTVFIAAISIAGVIKVSVLWVQIRLSYAMGAELSTSIYHRTLYQSYDVHLRRNSSEIIDGIVNKTNSVIGGVFLPLLTITGASLTLFLVVGALMLVSPVITLSIIGAFSVFYALLLFASRQRIKLYSKISANNSILIIKTLQEGLGGIRDIILGGYQETYCRIFRKADIALRDARGNILMIAQSPRYIFETIGMLILVTVVYAISAEPGKLQMAVPVLGAIGFGAQKILPALQQIYSGLSLLRAERIPLGYVLDLLEQPLPEKALPQPSAPVPFNSRISMRNISFKYNRTENWVLRDIDLEIPKGSRIGVIGPTGCGKTTLIDIIMGLLEPTSGTLQIDERAVDRWSSRNWQTRVAHVPQAIYLSDASVLENIAFGEDKNKIDRERVIVAAKQAQIHNSIVALPDGYDTSIGERGIRLSGGQRQRIGIARALYKKADVIIFDEATSALDSKTERAVMESIYRLDKDLTIVIIAHRLSSLTNCDTIVALEHGRIREKGTYDDIITQAT